MVYNNHSLPMMYDDWAKEKKNENRTIGFKESESDKYKAGWHPNKMNLTKGNITENGLLNQKNVSLVLGSTYTGRYPSTNASLTLYIDNVSVLEGETPCTAVKIENAPTKMVKGMKLSMSADNFAYTPDNTTQTQLTWTSSDEKIATVDENGAVKGVAAGTCTISVSAKNDPSVSADVDVAVRHLEEKDGCTYVDGILIVNKTYSLPESYDPAGLTDETQAALDKMIEDAYAAGLNLYDASDYRSYSDQISVYQEYCARDGWEQADTYSARPGHSEHQTGMVIDFNDINSDFDDTAEAQWLAENCANYGFIVRFPEGKEPITGYKYESWHVRYVGVETAKEIMSRGICLEEYLGVDSEYKNTWPEDPCNPESGVSEQ